MRNAGLFTTAFYTAVLSSGACAAAPLSASSSATIVSGHVTISTTSVLIAPQAAASGSGSVVYAARKALPSYSATISLPDATSLSVKTGALVDTASSTGVVGNAITAKAASAMLTPVFTLSNPFASGAVVVKADQITSSATFSASTKAAPSASGAANIVNGSVDLSLFGVGVFTYSGKPKTDAVLFKSKDGTVTVYGNRHVIGHANGSTVPTSITVYAIDVHLAGAKVLGLPVNGDLAAGTSIAR